MSLTFTTCCSDIIGNFNSMVWTWAFHFLAEKSIVFKIAGYVWVLHKMPSSTVSDKLFITVLIAVVGLLKNTTFSGEEPIGKNPKRFLRLVYIYFRKNSIKMFKPKKSATRFKLELYISRAFPLKNWSGWDSTSVNRSNLKKYIHLAGSGLGIKKSPPGFLVFGTKSTKNSGWGLWYQTTSLVWSYRKGRQNRRLHSKYIAKWHKISSIFSVASSISDFFSSWQTLLSSVPDLIFIFLFMGSKLSFCREGACQNLTRNLTCSSHASRG